MSEAQASEIFDNFGLSIEKRIQEELGGTLTDDYPEVKEIRNLAGENTGHMHVYKADKLVKACCMSVTVMPGARYFNIHIHPETKYRVPRFGFEGMIMEQGGQVSMDLYPDMDLLTNIKPYMELCGDLTPIWDEVKKSDLNPQPSRLPHMRAFCSPYFLNFVGVKPETLPRIEKIANQYFDVWLNILNNAAELSDKDQSEVAQRRDIFARRIIEMDPDRGMIVQVYGEEVTQAIENALMLS